MPGLGLDEQEKFHWNTCHVLNFLHEQSAHIAQGVDREEEVAAYVRRGLKKLQRLNEELAAMNDDGEWPFFGGSTPGVGDFTLFATLDMILAISPQALVTHQLTALIEWYVTMRGLPGVSEYLAARPQLGILAEDPRHAGAVKFEPDLRDQVM